MKRHGVGTRPYCSHFLCGNASPCRPVPPFSHKSFAFVGALYLIRFRNPRHSVEGFSARIIRAPGQRRHAALLLAFPVRKCFTLSAGASSFPQKQSFCGSPIPHPISKSAALGIMFFRSYHPRTGSSVTLAHVSGRPHRVAPTADARIIRKLQIYV